MTGNRWTGVRDRVARLAELPHAEKVFAGQSHRFMLADPLDAGQLHECEEQFGLRLPQDYRNFLLEVGAGGAGPAYGLCTIAKGPDDRWGCWGQSADQTQIGKLGEPFTAPSTGWMVADHKAREPHRNTFGTQSQYDAALATWLAEWDAFLDDDTRTTGAICLVHEGCGYYVWLVVTGPQAGQIWYDARAADVDLEPMRDESGEPLGFAAWYLNWLETSERVAG